jgi:hypothetical protein
MAKAASRTRKEPAAKLDAPEKLKVDLTRFKSDLTPNDLKRALTPVKFGDLNIFVFPTIDIISPTKTTGLGRTNLTVVRPVILQTDASPAFVTFDGALGSAQQRPTVSVHFEPSKYGLTGNVTFIMGFSIEAFGTVNLDLGAFAGSGTVSGTGPRTANGKQVVSLVFNNVPATQQVFGHVAQTGGARWNWFQTRISYLPVIVQA